MPDIRTSQGRSVPHCHIGESPHCHDREMTADERREARDWLFGHFPHLVEVRPPSWKYNCHGYAYAHARGWFNDPELFFEDDFYDVPQNSARKGDVLVYMNGEILTHSAIVKEVRNGRIKKLRSKWGPYSAVIHKPHEVDEHYGEPVRLLRRRRRRPNR
jgi:hypothetical protein